MDRSLNRVELKGRVGQDARILKVENGGIAARFTLATNELIKNRDETYREETTWHNIVAWSRKGMPDFNLIRKGTFLSLEGKIRYVKYTSAAGEEKNITEIVAQKIIIPLVE
ncbi:MAG: single-stranded DNA-binding protein [Bacteroidales bacterium]|nr:single-stranded DNA-binding protein [Bacteroidales bacterium]MBQ2913188.1 single-stranded DNA-binding protein [Bacteroidales bacterium]MBQ7019226.1 single-stranded DNA-binding protein [Bacteroidales bacterium]MBR2477752.1 single-stranded DNA-binding protein [Bacteroidales bacterium]